MVSYKVIHSDRRTLSLEITKDAQVLVRAPKSATDQEIHRFVSEHEAWIQKQSLRMEKRHQFQEENFSSPEQIEQYIAQAKAYLPMRTAFWAKIMHVQPTGVRITRAASRFGSCSPKNSICYSYRIMAYPEEVIDYLIVHELAHILHKNHGKSFYACVAQYLPDYRKFEAILQQKG